MSPPNKVFAIKRQRHAKILLSDFLRICIICGDRAINYNYGVICCESCKMFFRRNSWKLDTLVCIKNKLGDCQINTRSRRDCSACRLHKCLFKGMLRELNSYERKGLSRVVSNFSQEQVGSPPKLKPLKRPSKLYFPHKIPNEYRTIFNGNKLSLDMNEQTAMPHNTLYKCDSMSVSSSSSPFDHVSDKSCQSGSFVNGNSNSSTRNSAENFSEPKFSAFNNATSSTDVKADICCNEDSARHILLRFPLKPGQMLNRFLLILSDVRAGNGVGVAGGGGCCDSEIVDRWTRAELLELSELELGLSECFLSKLFPTEIREWVSNPSVFQIGAVVNELSGRLVDYLANIHFLEPLASNQLDSIVLTRLPVLPIYFGLIFYKSSSNSVILPLLDRTRMQVSPEMVLKSFPQLHHLWTNYNDFYFYLTKVIGSSRRNQALFVTLKLFEVSFRHEKYLDSQLMELCINAFKHFARLLYKSICSSAVEDQIDDQNESLSSCKWQLFTQLYCWSTVYFDDFLFDTVSNVFAHSRDFNDNLLSQPTSTQISDQYFAPAESKPFQNTTQISYTFPDIINVENEDDDNNNNSNNKNNTNNNRNNIENVCFPYKMGDYCLREKMNNSKFDLNESAISRPFPRYPTTIRELGPIAHPSQVTERFHVQSSIQPSSLIRPATSSVFPSMDQMQLEYLRHHINRSLKKMP